MKASRHADPTSSASLRPLLAGGDRRSIGRSNRALALVHANPDRVAQVAALAKDARRVFIGPLADSDQWEPHLQIVRALPFLRWTPRERSRVLTILRRDLDHPQLFVRAWALDSLARFAQDDATLLPVVLRHLAAFIRSGRPALASRAEDSPPPARGSRRQRHGGGCNAPEGPGTRFLKHADCDVAGGPPSRPLRQHARRRTDSASTTSPRPRARCPETDPARTAPTGPIDRWEDRLDP